MGRSTFPVVAAPFLLLLALLPSTALPSTKGRAGEGGNTAWRVARGEGIQGRSASFTPSGVAEFRQTLPPGKDVRYDLPLRWDGSGSLTVSLRTDRVNRTSTGYREGTARFPAYVTVVFGEDRLPLGWRKRWADFLVRLFTGFPPAGIRLTYASGGTLPAGSMYRLHEEETVFLLGGEDEAGKAIESTRDVRADFAAAYGREPVGAVTSLVAGGVRPSGEEGNAVTEVRVGRPGGDDPAP